MVKTGFLGLFMLFTLALAAQEVIVTSEIEGNGKVGMPLKGTITITHDRKAAIDENSFMLGEETLEAEYLKDVQVAPNSPLTISIYSFTLMPDEPGLKVLPEIKVNVGGKEYRSYASTYKVEEITAGASSPVKSSIVLDIEPLIEGHVPLYPGQRIKVGYRYIFNYSQDLKKEIVPLLEAKGFKKVGGKTQETKMAGKLVHLDVLQEVEAVEPGEYFFEPARIEGRAWRKGNLGQKDFAVRDSFAESKTVTIAVLPFPEQGKPGSFNGAIGENLTFKTTLLTSDAVTVGDKMKLKLEFKGIGELATLPLLEVCCQPGMSGFFRTNDLPPQEIIQGDTKSFTVEMRPLNDKATEIPSLEFSYFNPVEKTYHIVKSDPIPLVIKPLQGGAAFVEEDVPEEKLPQPQAVKEQKPVLGAIEIEGDFELVQKDLRNLPFGAPWVLYLIPFGIAALLFQKHLREYMQQKKSEVKEVTSEDLLQQAAKSGISHPRFYQNLHDAFVLRLYELGVVSEKEMATDRLPEEGAAGDVKAFLKEIEEKRFSQSEEKLGPEVIKRAKILFKEIGNT